MASTILLTGGQGMVGRNFLEHSAKRGLEVIAPSRRELDLSSYDAVERFIRKVKPDLVVHAAGRVGGIHANMKEPLSFFVENLDMGRNVVLGSLRADVRKLINLGSSCMYPRNAPNPLAEESILTGELEPTNEGYALAKIATARLCRYVNAERPDVAYKTLIPCNLYGPFDKFDPEQSHLVPAIIVKTHQAMSEGSSTVEIWGDGTARREFMYVGDLADCICEVASKYDNSPEVMNVGPGRDHSINDYYEVVAKVVGFTGEFTHDLTRPVGMKQKLVDTTLLNEWGWTAKTSLEDGIAKTYEHFLSMSKQ